MNKTIWKSKTFWLQIAAVMSAMLPPVAEWLAKNPVEFVAALAAANVLVRFATSGRVTIFGAGEGSDGKDGGQSPGGLAPLIVLCATVGALCGSLPSCGLPVKASVQVEEGALSYSSKGGLEMEYRPGYGRMPEHYRNTPSWTGRSGK